MEYFTDRGILDEDAEATLFDEDGSAIVIHSGVDDYSSQPSGGGGNRFACGVIQNKIENARDNPQETLASNLDNPRLVEDRSRLLAALRELR